MQIRDRIKELRRVKAKDLYPDERNWRTHPKEQVAAMQAILEELGYADALLAREAQDGKLVAIDGHLRQSLDPEQMVPVLILDLDEDEAHKLMVVLDPLASMAETNKDALGTLLFDVQTDNPALRAMLESLANQNGIDLFAEGGEGEGGLTDPDSIPEPPDEPVTKKGDRWILGDHVLLCGDSSSEADLDRLLGGQTIQLVNTDPPYNVNAEVRTNAGIAAGNGHSKGVPWQNGGKGPKSGSGRKMRARDRQIDNDAMSEADYAKALLAWFGNLTRVLDKGRSFYIWGGYANLVNYPPAMKEANLYFSQAIIWVKDWPVINRHDYMCNFEIAYYGWKPGAAHYFTPDIKNARDTWEIIRHRQKGKEPDPKAIDASNGAILSLGKGHEVFITGKIPDKTRRIEVEDQPIVIQTGPSDVWRVKKVNHQSMVHLTEKPVELATRAMKYSSKPGENVLDLFGGSGSTLMAAEITGRKAFLMELDEAYCDVIRTRWEQFTGKKAKLERATPNRVNNSNGQTKAKRKTAKRKAKAST